MDDLKNGIAILHAEIDQLILNKEWIKAAKLIIFVRQVEFSIYDESVKLAEA